MPVAMFTGGGGWERPRSLLLRNLRATKAATATTQSHS
jgi:hypothetical protein